MKRAREAQKELQRKTEVLASARGGGAREKKETTKTTTKDVEAREGEEKENGARKMKKTKASEVKDREEKRIERDRPSIGKVVSSDDAEKAAAIGER